MSEFKHSEVVEKMIQMGKEYCIAHRLNPQKLRVKSSSKYMVIFAEPNPNDHSTGLDHSNLPFVTLIVHRERNRETKEERYWVEETEYTVKYLK